MELGNILTLVAAMSLVALFAAHLLTAVVPRG